MGSGLTKSSDPSLEDLHAKRAITRKLDAELELDSRQDEEKIKLLLLGAGESGKSTIFKQMKIIYGTQFSEAERRIHTTTIHSNIILAMRVLVKQCLHQHDLPPHSSSNHPSSAKGSSEANSDLSSLSFMTPELQEHIKILLSASDNGLIDSALATSISFIWEHPAFQDTWNRRHEYQIIESLKYYMGRLSDIQQPNYIPTQDDILYNRVRTSGIVTERYIIDNALFEMYDVGGQRNERKKWIHCFEGVTAVIFVVALSEFDQLLYEDDKTNRMVEALQLFEEIVNNPFFQNSSIIIFFNKSDLFAEKIKQKSLRSMGEMFQDYEGADHDYDASVQYLVHRFLRLNHRQNDAQQIYYHVTCATDTHNIQVVFNACKDIVLRDNIRKSKLIIDYE